MCIRDRKKEGKKERKTDRKKGKGHMIKSAASATSGGAVLAADLIGGCASSRLDQDLKLQERKEGRKKERKKDRKKGKGHMIKSAASATPGEAVLAADLIGGCASSRLDQYLKL